MVRPTCLVVGVLASVTIHGVVSTPASFAGTLESASGSIKI